MEGRICLHPSSCAGLRLYIFNIFCCYYCSSTYSFVLGPSLFGSLHSILKEQSLPSVYRKLSCCISATPPPPPSARYPTPLSSPSFRELIPEICCATKDKGLPPSRDYLSTCRDALLESILRPCRLSSLQYPVFRLVLENLP